jgi:glycosyltransferase involved in cell wall biosynthesis
MQAERTPSPAPSPTVSVALCTYNGEQYVTAQLESIAAQTTPATEVLIFDDGSTDNTVATVSAFIDEHSGPTAFSLVSTTRAGGVAANFARALAACTGEFIALSDQDDLWRTDRIATALEFLATHPHVALVHSDARVVDAQGSPTGETLLSSLYVSDRELADIHAGKAFEVLIRRNIVTGAATMLRRSLLEHGLPLADGWVHDEWLAAIAAAHGGVDTIEQALIDYRVHGGNQIGVTTPTLSHRLSQLRVPRGDRLTILAQRASLLVDRVESIGAPEPVIALARRKARFETRRAAYPRLRLARLVPVLTNARGGNYATLSSQGNKDIVRDLVQPA